MDDNIAKTEGGSTLIVDMTEGPIARRLVRFSLPFMAANFMLTLYNIADLAIVGQYVGSVGLSAVSVSAQFVMLIMAVGIGFGNGGQIIISQIVGRRETERIPRAIGTMVTTKLALSLLVMAFGIAMSGTLMRLINTPAQAVEDATAYFKICCIGLPFIYLFSSFAASLRGMGDSKHPFYFIAAGTITNIALDLLFVAVFDMGVFGAAFATIISQALCCLITIIYIYRNRVRFNFDFKLKNFAVDRALLGMLVRVSLPLVFMTISINISISFVMSYVNTYGLAAAAVTGTGNKLYSVMSVVTQSVQSSVATMVGQNMGAKKFDRVRRIVLVGFVVCIVFFIFIGALCLLFPRQIFSVFNREAEVLALAVPYMRTLFFMYLSFALMAPSLGLITGIGFSTLNLGIALLDGVIARIGLSLLFGVAFGMGLEGFWWGSALACYVSVILGGAYFLSGRWRKRTLFKDGA